MERGFWRGVREIVDLGFDGDMVLERERWERDEIWEGTLNLTRLGVNWFVGGGRKTAGREIEERDRERERVGRDW